MDLATQFNDLGQEVGHACAMDHEEGQLLGVGHRTAHARGCDAVGFDVNDLGCDALQVVRVVVLAINDDQILGSASDHQLSVPDEIRGHR
jgi:hypothetical protein